MVKVEFAVPLIWHNNPSTGENEPRVRRKEGEENFITCRLADCPSYLNSLLHTTTLVRSTPPQ
jgi:hypothetical protein